MKRFEEPVRRLIEQTLPSWDRLSGAPLLEQAIRTRAGDLVRHAAEYLALCSDWTSRIDLVSGGSPEELVRRHLLDSFCAYAVLTAELGPLHPQSPVLDIGSGAGFPGVPFALLEPKAAVVLLEPREQRAIFLQEVRRRLGLRRVTVRRERLEDVVPPSGGYGLLVTRAVALEPELLRAARRVARDGAPFAALAGPTIDSAATGVSRTIAYRLPSGGEERRLVLVDVSRETPGGESRPEA